MQKWRVNKFNFSEHSKHAFKRATSWYNQEVQTKGKDGLSSYEVAKRVKVEFGGVGPSARTIQRYVNSGLAGLSLLKPGVKSDIPKWVYSALCMAFENRRDDVLTLKKFAAKVNETMQHNYRSKLLNRVLLSTEKDLYASKVEYCDGRRLRT
jgi:hypothetical protein